MNFVEDVGERIRFRRDQLGMSVEELAEKTGFNRATIYRYEKGEVKNMPVTAIPTLAKALKTTEAYLMGWTETPEKVRLIPILGKISCGDPILAEQNYGGYREEADINLPSGELFFVKTKGDSMFPTIPLDSYVLLREQSDVESGEIAAVLMCETNEVTLKRVKKNNNLIILYPDNSKYEPVLATEDNPIRILGKAIRISSDLGK